MMFLPPEVDGEYVRRTCAPCAAASGFPPHVMGVNPELLVRGYSGIGEGPYEGKGIFTYVPPTLKPVIVIGAMGIVFWGLWKVGFFDTY